jgi:hypothetical protein
MNKESKITNMERIDKASLLEVFDQSSVKLDGTIFHIKRHSDRTILIYYKNDKVLYESVLPFLRKINIEKKLDIDLCYPNSSEKKNTRDLGKDVIYSLNQNK